MGMPRDRRSSALTNAKSFINNFDADNESVYVTKMPKNSQVWC